MLGALSLILIALSERVQWVNKVEAGLSFVAMPFYWLADLPADLAARSESTFASREALKLELEKLKTESLILHGKTQKLASLRAENRRLRSLLNSSQRVEQTVLVAEVIGVDSDPTRHKVMINLDADSGIYEGQPVIDSSGLIGQVIEVGYKHSWVLMITDSTHAMSVQVNRNGVRALIEGTGRIDELELAHVPATTDIKPGDLLVSSGLARRFPVGFPVAEVTEVIVDPGQPFATVKAKPLAELDRSQHVLMVFTETPISVSSLPPSL